MQSVRTDAAPSPVASYSQAVRHNGLVQVSGQGPTDPDTGELVAGGIAAQTRQTLDNLRAILAEAGAAMDQVMMMRVYLTDTGDFEAMNEVYATYVTEPFPSRTTVYVGLPDGLRVEIDALAAVDRAEGMSP